MAFVNEYISDEDFEKYGLAEIDKKFIVGATNADDWTIDRERGIYLRNIAQGGGNEPEISNRTTWTFYWHDEPITLRLDLIDGGGKRGGPAWGHWRLVWVRGGHGLPEHLKPYKAEFLSDLEAALLAYKDGGIYSASIDYKLALDIGEESGL